MGKKRFSVFQRAGLLAVLIAALLLVACGNEKEAPQASPASATADVGEEQTTNTTILFAVNDVEQSLYEGLVESFEEANPAIHVQLVSINEVLGLDLVGGEWPDDAWQRLSSAADVINVQPGPEVVRQGLARDLSPLIQADPNFQQDDFYAGALERSQWDGGTWSLPTRVLFDVIYYDKDDFDEAGVSYPEAGWRWDDFLAAARALTVREGQKVTRWGFVQPSLLRSVRHLPFIEGRAGPLIDKSTNPPTPRFDQPEVAEAFRWYVDLYRKEEVVPFFDDEEGALVSGGQALVESGEAPMWHEWSHVWAMRKEQGNRGIVPYPVDAPDSRTTLIWSTGLYMSSGSAHPEAAWRWMDFVTRQDISRQGPLVRFLPPRRSVAESTGFWDQVDEELAAALRFAIDHNYITEWTTGHGAFFDALEATLSEEKSVESALAEAQTQAEAEIQETQAEQAEATPVPTVVVVAPEGQASAGDGAVTIVFNPGVGILSAKAYRDAAQLFQEAHPDIQVEIQMPDLNDPAISVKSVAANADCLQWVPDIQNPEYQAAILGLKPFLDADSSFSTDDFYPSVLERFFFEGQLWGLPVELQPYVIEYNKDLFRAAHVDEPALDWTTDDFAELAAALTRGEGDDKQYGFVPQAYEVNDLLLLMEPRGAQLVNANADPPTLTLNDPATVEAVRWYAGMSTELDVKPVFLADIADFIAMANTVVIEREALISEGRAAMWTHMGASAISGDRTDLDVGVAPLPAGIHGAAGSGTATGYFISAQTEAREACWQWITFLTKQPGLTQGLPARRSVVESGAYPQQVGAERAAVYRASVAGAERPSVFDILTGQGWLGGGMYWLGRAYGQVVDDEASAEEALNAAQRMFDDYRACGITREVTDRDGWQACMLEVDPTLPAFLFSKSE